MSEHLCFLPVCPLCKDKVWTVKVSELPPDPFAAWRAMMPEQRKAVLIDINTQSIAFAADEPDYADAWSAAAKALRAIAGDE